MKRDMSARLAPLAAAMLMAVWQTAALAATASYNAGWYWIHAWATGGPTLTYT